MRSDWVRSTNTSTWWGEDLYISITFPDRREERPDTSTTLIFMSSISSQLSILTNTTPCYTRPGCGLAVFGEEKLMSVVLLGKSNSNIISSIITVITSWDKTYWELLTAGNTTDTALQISRRSLAVFLLEYYYNAPQPYHVSARNKNMLILAEVLQ